MEVHTVIYHILLGTLLFFSRLQEQRPTKIIHIKGECELCRNSEISWKTRTPNGIQLDLMLARTGTQPHIPEAL